MLCMIICSVLITTSILSMRPIMAKVEELDSAEKLDIFSEESTCNKSEI